MHLVAVLLVVAACAATPQHDAAPPLAPGGVKQAPAARAVADLHEADAATLLDRDLDDYLAAAQPVRFVRDEVRGAGFAAALAKDAPPAKQDTAELAKKTQNPVADLISRQPKFCRRFAAKKLYFIKRPEQLQLYLDGLRKAGVPE